MLMIAEMIDAFRNLPTVHDARICGTRPDEQFQLCGSRYEVFHKILLIQNNFRELTSECVMNHRETSMHHKLRGKNGVIVEVNVSNLRDFVRGQANPFIIPALVPDCTTSG